MDSLHFDSTNLGITGALSLGLNGATGNTEKMQTNVDAHLKWNKPGFSNIIMVNYQYGKTNEVRDTNKAFLHFRHIHDIQDSNFDWELFSQVERDEFTRLSLRSLIGAGLRMPVIIDEKPTSKHYFGIGAFYSRESLNEVNNIIDDGIRNITRGNFYVLTKMQLTDTTRVYNTLYYQPNLETISDFRLLEVATLKVKMNHSLDLKLGLQITHDSEPVQTIKETDLTYWTGIEYSFK
jgi:putative salt-induced outer membrane protein YdiY